MRNVVLALTCVLACACSSGGSTGSSGSDAAAGSGGVAATGGTGATGGNGATGATGATGGVGGSGGAAGSTATGGSAGTTGDSGANPIVELDTTMGKMTFELDAVHMPITTANFLAYVDAGFFSGTLIHRVIPDFVIQGGGYTAGLVEKATNPPIQLETSPDILHDFGVISMARTTDPNSATSQFFVVNAPGGAHSLDGQYAAFGHMLEGDSVLNSITAVPTHSVSGFDDVPVTDVVVNSATRK